MDSSLFATLTSWIICRNLLIFIHGHTYRTRTYVLPMFDSHVALEHQQRDWINVEWVWDYKVGLLGHKFTSRYISNNFLGDTERKFQPVSTLSLLVPLVQLGSVPLALAAGRFSDSSPLNTLQINIKTNALRQFAKTSGNNDVTFNTPCSTHFSLCQQIVFSFVDNLTMN
jgi:hypothetical protein